MAVTTTAPSARPAETTEAEPRSLIDLGASALVWLYVLAQLKPLEQIISLPSGVVSVLFPVLGITLLALTPTERLARAPISLVLIGLVAWTTLSVYWSEDPTFTSYLIRYEVVPLLVLALVVATMPPRRVIRTLLTIVVVLGLASLAMAIVLPKGSAAPIVTEAAVTPDGFRRGAEVAQVGFRGGFGHKNTLGIFMILGLCLLVPLLRGRGRLVVISLFLVTIVGTRSATVAGGLLSVLFVGFWIAAINRQRTRRERQTLLVMAVSAGIAGVLLVLGALPTLLNLYDKDLTFSGRTFIWEESAHMISESPLGGYGLGGVWADERTAVTAELHRRIGFEAAHAHNSVLETLLELGVVGLVLTVLLIVQTLRLAFWCTRHPATVRYGQWGLLTVTALLLMGLAEPLFGGGHLGLLVIVWVVLARARIDERAKAPTGALGGAPMAHS